MSSSKTVLMLIGVLLVLLTSGAKCENDAASPPAAAELLDLSDPGSWEAAVADREARASKIAESLISAAQDKQRPDDDRKRAIDLLARLGDDESLGFLVANIDMYLPLEKIKGDEDEIRQRPCTYSLSGIRSGIRNWDVVPLILGELREPAVHKKVKLIDFAFVMGAVCGERTARAIIEQELSTASDPSVKQNLQTVIKYI